MVILTTGASCGSRDKRANSPGVLLPTLDFRRLWMRAISRATRPSNRCSIRFGSIAAVLVFLPLPLLSQAATCPPVPAPTPTPALTAYSESRYADAEQDYVQSLEQQPHNALLEAALIHTLLRENKIAAASDRVIAALAQDPHSAPLLTAQAEV